MTETDSGRVTVGDQALVNQAPAGLGRSGFDPSRKMLFSRKEVAGTLAMWAVRQSPYPVPDKMAEAVAAMHDALPEETDGWFWATADELHEQVETICLSEPLIVAWNEPKSGHSASMVFTSRYDNPSADDDFIDLHALARNIWMSVVADKSEFSDEPLRDSDGSGEADKTGTGLAEGDSAGRETASPETQGPSS